MGSGGRNPISAAGGELPEPITFTDGFPDRVTYGEPDGFSECDAVPDAERDRIARTEPLGLTDGVPDRLTKCVAVGMSERFADCEPESDEFALAGSRPSLQPRAFAGLLYRSGGYDEHLYGNRDRQERSACRGCPGLVGDSGGR